MVVSRLTVLLASLAAALTAAASSAQAAPAVKPSAAAKPAQAPAALLAVQSMAFSSSRLYFTAPSVTDEAGLPLWGRTVSGAKAPILSAAKLFVPRAVAPLGAASAISFSAGRGAIGLIGHKYGWQLLDRGNVTAYIAQRPVAGGSTPAEGAPKTSGPYTLIAGQVFRADGEFIYAEPDPIGADDLYGSRIVYSHMGATNRADIYLDDVTKPNPVRLKAQTCAEPPLVAIWGNLVVWQNCDRAGFTVENLNTAHTRQVSAGSGGGSGDGTTQLLMREGTLSWLTAGVTSVLDLTRTRSKPVVLAGSAQTIAVDDHRVALQASADDGGAIAVVRLPITGKHHPRLIGRLGANGFTPNGDQRSDTWGLEFDTTKPLVGVRLRITAMKSGKVFRTLTGVGPDGSIRDLTWNGRTSSGRKLPVGTYRWQLTARAADGDGALIAASGAKTIIGTVEIDAT